MKPPIEAAVAAAVMYKKEMTSKSVDIQGMVALSPHV
jgi:hypothetical protein